MTTVEPIRATKTVREFAGNDWIDGGYEFMEAGRADGWHAVSVWGTDGWDLGQWPYAVVLFRDREEAEDRGRVATPELATILVSRRVSTVYERAIYVEGDITVETYSTAEARQAATAETAAFYLSLRGPEYDGVSELAGWSEGDPVPERLRGPYGVR